MPEKWTGDVVGAMHVNKISYLTLAEKVGWHVKYLSAVLNGHRNPTGAEQIVKDALAEILANEDKTE